jgi:hypothetical protein
MVDACWSIISCFLAKSYYAFDAKVVKYAVATFAKGVKYSLNCLNFKEISLSIGIA